jgi:hypothetical protein
MSWWLGLELISAGPSAGLASIAVGFLAADGAYLIVLIAGGRRRPFAVP